MEDRRKSRRSSILKPPKPRNPLSDVDLNPPNTDATLSKSRRVSFANSNFIKEFTADPEKNTIWHNSYEEVVNKSEDSKNHEQQEEDFNNTLDETPLLNSPLETSICSAVNLEATTSLKPVLNLNHPDRTNFDEMNMEITGSIPINSNLMKNILKQQLVGMNKENQPYFITTTENRDEINDISMEITETLNVIITTNETNLQVDDMDTTSVLSDCIQFELKDLTTSSSQNEDNIDMEFTQAIPGGLKFIENQQEVTNESCDMEFTRAIRGGIKFIQSEKKDQSMNSNKNEMEFTQAIPGAGALNLIQSVTNKENEPCDMEFTHAIPCGIKFIQSEKNDDLNIQSKNSNKKVDNDLNGTKFIQNEMEFTQAMPGTLNLIQRATTTNKENEPCLNIQSMNSNKKVDDDGTKLIQNEMEYTQAMSGALNLIQSVTTTNKENEPCDMEFTRAIPCGIKFVQSEKKDDLNGTKLIQNEMEFTQPGALNLIQSVTTTNKENEPCLIQNVTTTNKEHESCDMEFTRAIPCGIKFVQSEKKDDLNGTKLIQNEMEFTQPVALNLIQSVTTTNKENEPCLIQSVTTINKENESCGMEFTRAMPCGIKFVQSEKNDLNGTKRQNENDNMEFTQAMPGTFKLFNPSILKLMNFSRKSNNVELSDSNKCQNKSIEVEEECAATNSNPNEKVIETGNIQVEKESENIQVEETENIQVQEECMAENIQVEETENIQVQKECIAESEEKIVEQNQNDTTKIVDDKQMAENKEIVAFTNIFHLKANPLICSDPAYSDPNQSDICLRIKYPGEDSIIPESDLTETNDCSISFTVNKSSFIDSTEKLINYQINYTPPSSAEKRQSTENICNLSQIRRKLSCLTSNNQEDAWNSVVEKTFINNDVLSSENVSLVDSIYENVSLESDETSISEFFNKIKQNLLDAIKYRAETITITDESLEIKTDEYKKRFDMSFKKPEFKDMSLEEKIREKSKDSVWNIIELKDVCVFNFMFNTIEFHVYPEPDSENVKRFELYSMFCEQTSEPAAVFVYRNVLRKKLTRNYITSALGQPYSILSLLDLITVIGEHMLDLLNEFDELKCRYDMCLNHDFEAKFTFFDMFIPVAFEVTLNISNLETISKDDVQVEVLVGDIDVNAIKKLINGCPQGIQLLRSFIVNVEDYMKFIKNIKKGQ